MAEKEYLKGIWDNDAEDNAFEYGLGWDSVKLFPFDRYGIQALEKGGDTLNYTSCVVTKNGELTMAKIIGEQVIEQSRTC